MYVRDYLDIDEFGVDKAFRRQGIASAMIGFLREYAIQKGFSRLELNMWEFNSGALSFYEAAGFRTYRRYMEMPLTSHSDLSPASTVSVRYALDKDNDFWFSLDRHISKQEYSRKVRDKQAYVLSSEGKLAAILRYSLFWDSIPFCNLLFVKESEQRKGYGRLLMTYWEEDMKARGYKLVMTSTQSDENAQHFYRSIGYQDCGSLTFPFPGFEQPLELILAKTI